MESWQLAWYPAQALLVWLARSMRLSGLSGKRSMNEAVRIHVNRKLFGLAAVGFGVVGIGTLSREISAGSFGVAAIILILFGGGFAYYARGFVRRGPVIVIDPDGLSGVRIGQMIRWTSIGDVHVTKRQGVFGEYHHLVITVRREDRPSTEDSRGLWTSRVPTETVDFSIDLLAMPWGEVVAAVEGHLEKDIATRKQRGPFPSRAA